MYVDPPPITNTHMLMSNFGQRKMHLIFPYHQRQIYNLEKREPTKQTKKNSDTKYYSVFMEDLIYNLP